MGSSITITPREIIFSIFIVGILYTIGFFIAGAIDKKVSEKNLHYRQAIQIRDSGIELKQASETDVGNAFVEGDFRTVDPVTWDGLEGEHLYIRRDKERYTMHTRTVHYTVTDSKGRSHTRTRTEHYWTWDVVGSDSRMARNITLCGNEYPTSTFNYDYIHKDVQKKDTGFRTRDVFYYKPKNFRGVIFAQLKEGTILGRPTIEPNTTIEQFYEVCTTSYMKPIFWILWWIFIAICVCGFVAIENRWLEKED